MYPFRGLLYPPKSLNPVKEMLLQELVYLVVIAKLSVAFLKMLDPVETCILDFWWKTLLHSTTLNVSC
jgi:hypothetical protein